jgi:hypothetical protein
MDRITYQDLIVRFGRPMAFDLLLKIERLARIRDDISRFDEEARLQKALAALDETVEAAGHQKAGGATG